MRIQQLAFIRYGKFSDRLIELPAAARDIHVLVGPNEAGKSTARAAIGDLLFGIPTRTPLAFLHPMPELRLGAVIEHEGQLLPFHRTKGNKQTLRSPADAVLSDLALKPWLGEATRPFFEQMFALDHGALVRGGDGILSAADDLGRMLFQSAAGIEQLGRVLSSLETQADGLWAPRKSASRVYYAAQEAYEQAGASIKAVSARPKLWKDQLDSLQHTEKTLGELQQQQVLARGLRSQLERIRRTLPMLRAYDTACARLEALGPVPRLPENAASALTDAEQQLALSAAEMQRHTEALHAAQGALSELQLDHAVLALAEDIRALDEQRLQYRAYRSDISKREEEIQAIWHQLLALAGQLAWPVDTEAAMRKRLPSAAARATLDLLLQSQGALAQRRASTQEALAAKQWELAAATEAQAALPLDAISPALQAALGLARKLGDHEAVLQGLKESAERLAVEADQAQAGLGAWCLNTEQLRAMVVPDSALLQRLLGDQGRDEQALRVVEQRLSERTAEHDKTQLAFEQLVATFAPVSRAQVLSARLARDNDWAALKAQPSALQAHAPAYEQRVRAADELADTRLDKLQHELEGQACAQRLATLRLDIAQEQARRQAQQQHMAARQTQWAELAAACQLPGLPLEMAPEWLALRRRALDARAAADEAQAQWQAKTEQGAAVRLSLLAQLRAQSEAQPGAQSSTQMCLDQEPSFLACVRAAELLVEQSTQTRGQRATLKAQIADARKAQADLQKAGELAEQQWQAWERQWADACAAACYTGAMPVAQVRGELDLMARIELGLDKAYNIRIERIHTMQADLEALASAAHELALQVAPGLLAQPVDGVVLALAQRLSVAREAKAESQRLQEALRVAGQGLALAQVRMEAVQAQLAPLYGAAGTHERAALRQAIEQSDQHRQLTQNLAGLAQSLDESGDGLSVDQLRAEASTLEVAELLPRLEQLAQDEDLLVGKIKQVAAEQAQVRALLAAYDGSDQAARAESERQDAITRMAQAVDDYLKLHTAAKLLRWSIDRYRQTRQGPMLAMASTLFAGLTLGSFSRLVVDFEGDTPRLQGLRPEGKLVGVEGMSEGSRDQLYLALRLAALDMHVQQSRALPFIADDLFINFDDRRTAAGLQALGELSRKTQVLLLTHHDHLLPLMREVLGEQVNVVML